jgi:hypothetical protein
MSQPKRRKRVDYKWKHSPIDDCPSCYSPQNAAHFLFSNEGSFLLSWGDNSSNNKLISVGCFLGEGFEFLETAIIVSKQPRMLDLGATSWALNPGALLYMDPAAHAQLTGSVNSGVGVVYSWFGLEEMTEQLDKAVASAGSLDGNPYRFARTFMPILTSIEAARKLSGTKQSNRFPVIFDHIPIVFRGRDTMATLAFLADAKRPSEPSYGITYPSLA